MGWMFTYRRKGVSNRDWFAQEFDNENGHVIDVACGTINRNNVYIAYKAEKSGDVVAIMCLTRWTRDSYYNFGYKDMDETMGPYMHDCPQRIIDQLTPTDNEYALKWRERVAEWRQKWDNKPSLQVGNLYTCENDLHFSNCKVKAGALLECINARRMWFTHHGFRFALRKRTLMELQEA